MFAIKWLVFLKQFLWNCETGMSIIVSEGLRPLFRFFRLSSKEGCNWAALPHKISRVTLSPFVFLSSFSAVENVGLQSSQEDLRARGHDSPLFWWLGQIHPACCQHQHNLKHIYTFISIVNRYSVNTYVWKLLLTFSKGLSFNNVFPIKMRFLWFSKLKT